MGISCGPSGIPPFVYNGARPVEPYRRSANLLRVFSGIARRLMIRGVALGGILRAYLLCDRPRRRILRRPRPI